MSLTTPAARRDVAFHLHPSTNLRQLQREGPLVISENEIDEMPAGFAQALDDTFAMVRQHGLL